MAAFDVAAIVFLFSCCRFLGCARPPSHPRACRSQRRQPRPSCWRSPALSWPCCWSRLRAETIGHNPEPFTKSLIIATLALAWLFSNTVYALHYAHLAYASPNAVPRLEFPARRSPSTGTSSISLSPAEWRSRRRTWRSPNQHIRKVVTLHCLAAFAFNIGALASPSTCSHQAARRRLDLRRHSGLARARRSGSRRRSAPRRRA